MIMEYMLGEPDNQHALDLLCYMYDADNFLH